MSAQETEPDTVAVPTDRLAELARSEIKLDCELRTHAPEGVEVDVWDHINTADVEYVEWADGDLHVALESTTTLQEQVSRATHHHPAEYRHHDADVLITIMWDMDANTMPLVDVEVVER